MSPMRIGAVDMYDALAELDPSDPLGQVAVVLNPLGIYVYTSSGWQLVGAPSGSAPPPAPASESGQGVGELATESEVQSGATGVLVATVARLKAELDRRDALPSAAATETARGTVELATTAEAMSGTLTGAYAMNPARVRESIQPEAWIAPTLLNSWVNFGAPWQTAAYRKTPWNGVELRGLIKNGTITTGTVLFTLPAGYRPANDRVFVSFHGGGAAGRINVLSNGDVTISNVTDNTFLSLEPVRFDV
jgi:hypothetical protein